MSIDELPQDSDKEQGETTVKIPKQMMSSWDSDLVMVGPRTKEGREEGGSKQNERSAKLDKQGN